MKFKTSTKTLSDRRKKKRKADKWLDWCNNMRKKRKADKEKARKIRESIAASKQAPAIEP